MQEMYQMSINIHATGVLALIIVLMLNMIILKISSDIVAYSKKMRRFMPISSSILALIIFTGVVMMAAKHLDFTLQNIVMILFALFAIIVDIYRYKSLKASTQDRFRSYQKRVFALFISELVLLIAVIVWAGQ